MNLSLLISKYSWILIIIGIIAWVTYMSLKKPKDPKNNPDGKLSRLGLAIEKAKPIFENFQKNVSETYSTKPTEEKKEEPKTKKEEKKEVSKENPFETKLDNINAETFKPIDF